MALNDSLRADLIKELQETVEDEGKEDIKKRYDPQTNTLYGENAGDAYTNDEIREGVMYYKYQKEKVATSKNEAYYCEMAAYALDSVYKQRRDFNIDKGVQNDLQRFVMARGLSKGAVIEQALKFYMEFEKKRGK